jgi:hypothetical protein
MQPLAADRGAAGQAGQPGAGHQGRQREAGSTPQGAPGQVGGHGLASTGSVS